MSDPLRRLGHHTADTRRVRGGVDPAVAESDWAGPGSARSPGTSKWSKIDHRTSSTTTTSGLTIRAAYDPNWYPKTSESPTPNSPPPYPSFNTTGTATGITPLRAEARAAEAPFCWLANVGKESAGERQLPMLSRPPGGWFLFLLIRFPSSSYHC